MARRRKKHYFLKRSDHRLDLGPTGYNLFVSRDKQQAERSARHIRLWMRAVISLAAVGAAAVVVLFVWSYLVPYFHAELQIGGTSSAAASQAPEDDSALPVYDSMGLEVYGDDLNLFVINAENPDPDYVPDLAEAAGVQVDRRIANAVELMAAAAREDGLALTFVEGYVSGEEQGRRFQAKVEELMEGPQSMTAVMARSEARTLVPRAGESDFQTGLCLRLEVAGDGESFQTSKTYSWLRNNMGKYGFVFRYPEGKETYTGCAADPAVIRYVGSATAAAMQQRSMCLEEYISYRNSQG